MIKKYHYKGCGLDYVYLINGYKEHETPYGKGVSITCADELHHTISISIITGSRPIRGQEVRFLRSILDISQADLANILGVRRLEITRWEKDNKKAIPGTADVALRLFSAYFMTGNSEVKKLIEYLKERDEQEYNKRMSNTKTSKLSFRSSNCGWTRAA